ncbi:hypothetical protein [Candidatus Hecatella orcuttiae]|uniref:hypothetical protein n=1 Tax=Candidatus Hecatella orcuttiae TaxID=1935119 RepID=UPI002867DBBE|nr:hypothetical protein [Candidatus Hecatella orcuttiae]
MSPRSYRVNRGKMSLSGLAETAEEMGVKYVMILGRWAGGPGRIDFYKTEGGTLTQIPPVLYIKGVRLQREFDITWRKSRKRISRLGVFKASTPEGQKLAHVLSKIFGAVPLSPGEGLKNNWAYMKLLEEKTFLRGITFYSSINGFKEIGPFISLRGIEWGDTVNNFENGREDA